MVNEYITDAIVKKNISHYRKLNNIPLSKLAFDIGITENKLAQILYSSRCKSVPLDVIKKCSVVFNVPIEKLMN